MCRRWKDLPSFSSLLLLEDSFLPLFGNRAFPRHRGNVSWRMPAFGSFIIQMPDNNLHFHPRWPSNTTMINDVEESLNPTCQIESSFCRPVEIILQMSHRSPHPPTAGRDDTRAVVRYHNDQGAELGDCLWLYSSGSLQSVERNEPPQRQSLSCQLLCGICG